MPQPGAVPSARQRIPASLPAPGARTVWRRRSHPSPGHAAVAQAPCRSCRSRSPALPCRAASGRSLPWRSGWRPPQTARHSPGRVPPGGDSPPPPVPGIPATEECRRTLRPAPAPRACRAPPASPAGAPPFRTVPGQLFRPDSPEQAAPERHTPALPPAFPHCAARTAPEVPASIRLPRSFAAAAGRRTAAAGLRLPQESHCRMS